MTNAQRDGNRVPTLIGVSSDTTGSFVQDVTPVSVRVDPITKRLYVDPSTTASIDGASAPVIDSYSTAAINTSANTANQALVAAPGANKQIWVYGIQFTLGTGDGSVSFQDSDDTAISGVMPFSQTSGLGIRPSGNFAMPLWKVATNKAFEVDTVTCDIKGSIQYGIVDVS